MLEEDENFFKNLHLTQIHKGSNILFNEKGYQDKDYFKDFPTIYHLRKALTDPEKVEKFKSDGRYYRFLFLAIHDMLKNRGHFLITSDLDFSNLVDIKNQKEMLLKEIVKSVLEFAESKNIDDKPIPKDTDVIAEIKEYIDKPIINQKKNYASYIYSAITGKTINFSKLFDVNEKTGLSFKKPLEDLITNVEEVDYIVNKMFSYFSLISAEKIITGDSKSLSEFKIRLFENHHNTLSMLKELFKSNKDVYKKIFKKDGVYEKFIGNGKEGYISFIEKLKDIFNSYFKNETVRSDFLNKAAEKGQKYIKFAEYLLSDECNFDDVDKGYTLYTPTNFEYSREVMNQLHLAELRKILEISPLSDSIKKSLEILLTFKADYYLGPLSSNVKGKNQWLVKKEGFENEKVTPFNLDQVVDKVKTNYEFISRMQRPCKYLVGEKTMQQETILYQDYIFHDIVNKFCFGENMTPITMEEKGKLYNRLLDSNKKQLTPKMIKDFIEKEEDVTKAMDFNANNPSLSLSLSAHRKFREIFGYAGINPEDYLTSNKVYFFDHIINDFSCADSNSIEAKIAIIKRHAIAFNISEFKDIELNNNVKLKSELTSDNFISGTIKEDDVLKLNKLMQLKSNKKGKLSFKFLNLFLYDQNGEFKPLIVHLRESNLNLQELLYIFGDENIKIIAEENAKKEKQLNKRDPNYLNQYLVDKFIPGLIRRPIVQANKLIDEIIEIMGGTIPSHITLEFTRTNNPKDKNKQTTSRVEQIKKQIENIKDKQYIDCRDKLLVELKNNEKDPDLNSKKLFLYFSQLGKDMYTGKSIRIDDLDNYDIDHVFPQSKITDESIHNNLVLTSKDENRKKSDKFPLSLDIQDNMLDFWKILKKSGILNEEKFIRLTRKSELTEQEINSFENRQKNVLDWVNKAFVDFLKNHKFKNIENFKIVYSKSSYVGEFRTEFGFLKNRNLNKLHHAHDAYLNEILAKIFQNNHTYHSDGTVDFKDKKVSRNLKLIVPKLTVNVNGKKIPFKDYFENIFKSEDQLITKMTEIRSTGKFWDETIYGKNEGNSDLPVKRIFMGKNIAHFNKPKNAFFTIVELKTKGENGREQSSLELATVPIYQCFKFYDDKVDQQGKIFNLAKFKAFILEAYSNKNTVASLYSKIAEKPIIPFGTLCEIDGVKVRLAGKTNDNFSYHNVCNLTIKEKQNYLYYRWLDKEYENISKDMKDVNTKIYNDYNEKLKDDDNFKNSRSTLRKYNENLFQKYCEIIKNTSDYTRNTVVLQKFLGNKNNVKDYFKKFEKLDFFVQIKLLLQAISALLKNSENSLNEGTNENILEEQNYLYYQWLDKEYENISKDFEAKRNDIRDKYIKKLKLKPHFKKLDLSIEEYNSALMREIYETIERLYNHKKITTVIQRRFLVSGEFNTSEYITRFQKLDLLSQFDLLKTVISSMLKSNVSNQGEIFDLGNNTDIENRDKKVSFGNFTTNKKIDFDFSLIRESITGFKSKKIIIYKK